MKSMFFISLMLLSGMSRSEQSFQLKRLTVPGQSFIDKEASDLFYRDVKRTTAKALKAVAVVATIYVAFKANAYFQALAHKDMLLAEKVKLLEVANATKLAEVAQGGAAAISLTAPQASSGIWSAVMNIPYALGKFVAEGSPTVLASIVLNGLADKSKEKISQAAAPSTVQGFVQEQTKIGQILKDLQVYTIEYDLHSNLLNVANLNQHANIHITAFMQDIVRLAKEQKQNDFLGQEYFAYLFDEVKKQYVKKGSELEKLQDIVVPAVAKADRAKQQGAEAVDLFNHDMNHRKDIADLCNMLLQDIQKTIAFIMVYCDQQKHARVDYIQKIYSLIDTVNAYVERMEGLLNSEFTQLEESSKANQGMFTVTYEFEKLLREQMGYIHQYCG